MQGLTSPRQVSPPPAGGPSRSASTSPKPVSQIPAEGPSESASKPISNTPLLPLFDRINSLHKNSSLEDLESFLPELIENGVPDIFIEKLFDCGPKMVETFWDKHADWPFMLKENKSNFCSGKLNDGLIFYPQANELFTRCGQEYLKEGEKYCGFLDGINYGHFIGYTRDKQAQGFIANILWGSLILKRHDTTGFQTANKLAQSFKNRELPNRKKFSYGQTFCSPQGFQMLNLAWNQDTRIDDKHIGTNNLNRVTIPDPKNDTDTVPFMTVGGNIALIGALNFFESPLVQIKGEIRENKYCIISKLTDWNIITS